MSKRSRRAHRIQRWQIISIRELLSIELAKWWERCFFDAMVNGK